MRTSTFSLALLLSTGCVAINPPSDHESTPIAVGDFCARLSETICEGFYHCCDDPTLIASVDRDDCEVAYQEACNATRPGTFALGTIVRDPITGYDPAIAGEVIGEARAYVLRCDPTIVGFQTDREGFLRFLLGTIDGGSECVRGNPLESFPAFYACSDLDRRCVLDGTFLRGTCLDRVREGDRCVLDFDCAEGLYCEPALVGESRCAPTLPDDAACTRAGDDQSGWCTSGLCRDGVCVPPSQHAVYCGVAG